MKHPCHKEQLTNLRRIEGQIRGIQGMIEEGRYCAPRASTRVQQGVKQTRSGQQG